MYRVLIVDDEKIVRIAMQNIIKWQELGLEIIGTANDGDQALDMIQKHTPEILITDLSMPKKSGLELIKDLEDIGYKGKIIVLSNYSDFEMVKEAMKHGAIEYFLKVSLNDMVLFEFMNKLVQELDEDVRNGKLQSVNDYKWGIEKTKIKELYLSELLLNRVSIDDEKAKQYELFVDDEPYCFIDIIIEQQSEKVIDGIQLTIFSIRNIIYELTNAEHNMHFVSLEDNRYVIFLSLGNKTTNDLLFVCRHIQKSLKMYLGMNAALIIGNVIRSIREISQIRHQLLDDKINLFYEGYSCCLYRKPKLGNDLNTYETSIKNLLADIKKIHNHSEFEHLANDIEKVLQSLNENRLVPENIVKRLKPVFKLIEQKVSESISIDEFLEYQNNKPEYENSSTLEQLIDQIKALVEFMQIAIKKSYTKKYSDDVIKILTYLEKNYEEKITLDIIERKVNLNRSYICRCFKKEIGESIMSYLNNFRLEKACNELKLTNKTIKEVASEVGIHDSIYFNKMFKKKYGVSPTSYRNIDI